MIPEDICTAIMLFFNILTIFGGGDIKTFYFK